MKTVVALVLAAVSVWTLGCARREEAPVEAAPAPPASAPAPIPAPPERPRLSRVNIGNLTGTVEAVDVATRSLTLRDAEGPITLTVREGVPGFETLQVGDQVEAEFVESTAIWVAAPGEPAPTMEQLDALEAELPTGGEKVTLSVQQVTATVEAIDAATRMVTLKSAEGRVLEVNAQEDVQLDRIQVGDQVTIRITQTLAVAIEKVAAAE